MALRLGDGVLRILGDTSDAEQKVGRLKGRLSGMFGKAGRLALMGGAAGLLAVGGAAAKGTIQFASFEDAMLNTRTMANWTDEEMSKISGQIIGMSKNFPEAYGGAQQLATAFYDIVSAGIPADQAMSVLQASAVAATGGATDTAVAVDGLTTVLNAFKIDAKNAGSVADTMFAAVAAGKMTFEELAGTMFDVAPVAAANGVSFKEVAGALATMTKSGTPARVATTQLRQAILAVTAPGAKMKALLKDLGYESGQAAIKELGLQGVLNEVAKASEGNTEKMKELIPSVEAVQGVLGLTGMNAKTAASDLRLMEHASDGAGMAQQAMETKMEGLSSTFGKFQSVLTAGALGLGEKLAPALKGVLNFLIDLIGGTGTAGRAFGALTGFVGGLVTGGLDLIKAAMPTVNNLIRFLATEIIPGLVAAVQGIFAVWQQVWPTVRDIFVQVFTALSAAVSWFTTNILPTLQRWIQQIVNWFVANWPLISNVMKVVFGIASFIIQGFIDIFNLLLSAVMDVWPAIQVVIETVMGVISGIIETIMAIISGDWGKAWAGIKKVFVSLWNGIIKFIGTIPRLILGILKGLLVAAMAWAGGFAGRLLGWAGKFIGNLVGWFARLPGRAMGAVSNLLPKLLGWLGSLAGKAVRAIGDLIGKIVGWFRKMPGKAVDAVRSLPGQLLAFIKAIPGKIWDAVTGIGKSIMDGIINGITGMVGAAKDAVTGAVGNIVGGIGDFLGISSPSKVFRQIGEYSMEGLAQGLSDGRAPMRALDGTLSGLARSRLDFAGAGVGAAGGSPVHIENLHLPNVKDVPSFVDELRHLSETTD